MRTHIVWTAVGLIKPGTREPQAFLRWQPECPPGPDGWRAALGEARLGPSTTDCFRRSIQEVALDVPIPDTRSVDRFCSVFGDRLAFGSGTDADLSMSGYVVLVGQLPNRRMAFVT